MAGATAGRGLVEYDGPPGMVMEAAEVVKLYPGGGLDTSGSRKGGSTDVEGTGVTILDLDRDTDKDLLTAELLACLCSSMVGICLGALLLRHDREPGIHSFS